MEALGPAASGEGDRAGQHQPSHRVLCHSGAQVAVSRVDPNLVAVPCGSTGYQSIPTRVRPPANARRLPRRRLDGQGNTFNDTDLMPILRLHTDPDLPTQPAPGLFYCNWSWVSIGDDRPIYAGGSMFAPSGDIGWSGRPSAAPKQGRAMITVSSHCF